MVPLTTAAKPDRVYTADVGVKRSGNYEHKYMVQYAYQLRVHHEWQNKRNLHIAALTTGRSLHGAWRCPFSSRAATRPQIQWPVTIHLPPSTGLEHQRRAERWQPFMRPRAGRQHGCGQSSSRRGNGDKRRWRASRRPFRRPEKGVTLIQAEARPESTQRNAQPRWATPEEGVTASFASRPPIAKLLAPRR